MRERMKVMVAVDGSIYSAAALDDVHRAGLPADAEVCVVSVADTMQTPPVSDFDLVSLASGRIDAVISREKDYRELMLNETARFASKAAESLRADFPGMNVVHHVLQGKPEDELLRKAWEWQPDLIITGSHGHTAIKRFLLGSVSNALADRSEASVRIVPRRFHEKENGPVKLLIGAIGSMDAEHVVDALTGREWPEGTGIGLMIVNEYAHSGEDPSADELTLFQEIVKPLNKASSHVSIDIRTGNPESVLLAQAESWNADSIIIPASSLGKHAPGLVAGNICPIEVVR